MEHFIKNVFDALGLGFGRIFNSTKALLSDFEKVLGSKYDVKLEEDEKTTYTFIFIDKENTETTFLYTIFYKENGNGSYVITDNKIS